MSLLLFAVFLFRGPLHPVDLGLGTRAALALDAVLCLAFFVQHSAMVRAGFRSHLARLIRSEYHAAVYSTASGLVLLGLLLLWQPAGPQLFEATGVSYWILRGLFVLALIGFAWSEQTLRSSDMLGTTAIRRHLSGKPTRESAFVVRGPYRWVRHPFYLFSLVLIWSYPAPATDRLIFNVLFTMWILVGTVLEERDLVAEFGDSYRRYQREVPMLFPLHPKR